MIQRLLQHFHGLICVKIDDIILTLIEFTGNNFPYSVQFIIVYDFQSFMQVLGSFTWVKFDWLKTHILLLDLNIRRKCVFPNCLPEHWAVQSWQKRGPALLSKNRAKNLATTYSRGTLRPTTISCSGLNGRVRDGNGWNPRQIITRKGSPMLNRAIDEKSRNINREVK